MAAATKPFRLRLTVHHRCNPVAVDEIEARRQYDSDHSPADDFSSTHNLSPSMRRLALRIIQPAVPGLAPFRLRADSFRAPLPHLILAYASPRLLHLPLPTSRP